MLDDEDGADERHIPHCLSKHSYYMHASADSVIANYYLRQKTAVYLQQQQQQQQQHQLLLSNAALSWFSLVATSIFRL